jgi:hypothetical protein
VGESDGGVLGEQVRRRPYPSRRRPQMDDARRIGDRGGSDDDREEGAVGEEGERSSGLGLTTVARGP